MTRVQELITEINCSTEGWNPYNIGRVTGAVSNSKNENPYHDNPGDLTTGTTEEFWDWFDGWLVESNQ